ncbi:hypothetical protein D3C76_1313430 [compost metagenome]
MPAADIGRHVQRVLTHEQGVQAVQAGEGGAALFGQGGFITGHAQVDQRRPALQGLEMLGGEVQSIAVDRQGRQVRQVGQPLQRGSG